MLVYLLLHVSAKLFGNCQVVHQSSEDSIYYLGRGLSFTNGGYVVVAMMMMMMMIGVVLK
jgi:hypothetical protein